MSCCSIMSTWLNNCVPKCFQHLVMKSSHSPSVFSVNNLANAQTLSSFVKCQWILGWILHLCILVCFLPDAFFIEMKTYDNERWCELPCIFTSHFTCTLHNVLMDYLGEHFNHLLPIYTLPLVGSMVLCSDHYVCLICTTLGK